MKRFTSTIAACVIATTAQAENITVKSAVSVDQAVGRLTQAVEDAGARVFTTVNFAQGSTSVGNALRPTQVVIFGSPKIGADALLEGQTMGLFLPLRVLAYQDAMGETWLMYPDPEDAAIEHGIPADHPAVQKMKSVLAKMTKLASAG